VWRQVRGEWEGKVRSVGESGLEGAEMNFWEGGQWILAQKEGE
jgi:hypothetical protein